MSVCCCFAIAAFAQSEGMQHNNLTFGIGAAIPAGNATHYLSAAPLLKIGYGYRFNRWLQGDAGLQMAFGAASTGASQQGVLTEIGAVQGGDHEFMVPLGGRVFIPQPFKRFLISAGGGPVYLHYSEIVPSNGGFYTPACYSCTSRGGWGGYGLANVTYFLDGNHNFRAGATFQLISASTNGQAVGNVPANKTMGRWANVSFEFGLSF